MDAGAIPGGGTGDDSVLQENGQEAGDEWIASLLSGASSDAVAAAMPGPGEVDLLDPQSTEGEEDQVIVVTGTRTFTGRSYDWDGGGGGGGATGGGHSGSSGGSGFAVPVASHPQDCGTEDGAAVQVARHVKGELPDGVSGPVDPLKTSTGNTWKTVEFGALVVQNPDGSFGALNDTIYSQNLNDRVNIAYNTPQPIQGLWHSHPASDLSAAGQAKVRYPSAADWSTLANIAGGAGAVSNPSLWIMDFDGITREFKLDERGYFESLSDKQKEEGEGLAGRERRQSCG